MGSPFNGDTFIQEEFLRLRDKYSLTTAVETGTNHGDTTVWLARNFLKTVSCEIDHNLVQPLLDELETIAKYELLPVIAIHDFKVPGGGLGFDAYNGQEYTFEWIKPKIDKIYSFKNRGYKHYYNTPEKACGAMRGIIYIVPA